MFPNVGWGELLLLAVVGLVVFGPNKLPHAVADFAKLMRQLREMARNAAGDLKSELGPEMADLDLRALHPRSFFADAFSDDEPAGIAASTPVGRAPAAPLAAGETAPYDPDAT